MAQLSWVSQQKSHLFEHLLKYVVRVFMSGTAQAFRK